MDKRFIDAVIAVRALAANVNAVDTAAYNLLLDTLILCYQTLERNDGLDKLCKLTLDTVLVKLPLGNGLVKRDFKRDLYFWL